MVISDRYQEAIAVVLAAGKGKRMPADRPKPLVPLCGRPMVAYVLDAIKKAGIDRITIVVGHQEDNMRASLRDGYRYVTQRPLLGTGHAFAVCADRLARYDGTILVTYADKPLVQPETISNLVRYHRETGAAATLLTGQSNGSSASGRIVRDDDGQIHRVVEAKDATEEQLLIPEVNAGVYCFESPLIFRYLSQLPPRGKAGEYYLTDLIELLSNDGLSVQGRSPSSSCEIMNVNTLKDLFSAQYLLDTARRLDPTMVDLAREESDRGTETPALGAPEEQLSSSVHLARQR